MFGRRRGARDRKIAAYVRDLRAHNRGGVGAPEAARFSLQDGHDYTEAEVSRVMSAISRGLL